MFQFKAVARSGLLLLVIGSASVAGIYSDAFAESNGAPPATAKQTATFASFAVQADKCADAHGTTKTPIDDGSGFSVVNYSTDSIGACGMLYMAEDAASVLGGRDEATADWLASFGSVPREFLACLSKDGFATLTMPGSRYDLGSAAFASSVERCAAASDVTVPAR